MIKSIFLLTLLFIFCSSVWANRPKLCHYDTWDWSVKENRSVNHRNVVKNYSDLTKEELGPIAGCSLCEEDQVLISIPQIPKFKVCHKIKGQIEKIILEAQKEGFPFYSIVGYRVGKSLGKKNEQGLRTQFSTHSYGLAIDFNSKINGMYNSCPQFSSKCQLIHGGNYLPEKNGALTSQSTLYKELTRLGFKWGGEQVGNQKDFMHFSKEKENTIFQ